MPHSLLRFTNLKESRGQNLYWGRTSEDGVPFRGPFAPIMPDDEYEARVVRVADCNNGFFDTTIPAENAEFLTVMEGCANGWYRLVYVKRFWQGTTKHYVEWIAYFMEDGTPTPFSKTQGTLELNNGQ